jgi:leucyl-tRNA synthetase
MERYGADTTRCYIMFIGPPDQDADWRDDDIEGVYRFLSRLWRLGAEVSDQGAPRAPAVPGGLQGDDLELMRKAHWSIEKVTSDMTGRFAFNTAIAAVMELVNECYRRREGVSDDVMHFAASTAASLIFPFAPHCGAEVYDMLTGDRVWEQPWPDADPAFLERDTVQIVVQVNGKVRDRFETAAGSPREAVEATARELPNAQVYLDGHEVVKVVVVPDKLVNFVVR